MIEDDENTLVHKFRAIRGIQRYLGSGFSPETELGLKDSEYRTMMEIRFHEGFPMHFYCEKVGLEQGSFTYIVDKLESKDVLVRRSDPEDRRKKSLYFTEKGRAITADVQEQFKKHLLGKYKNLEEKHRKALVEAMELLEPIVDSLLKEQTENE